MKHAFVTAAVIGLGLSSASGSTAPPTSPSSITVGEIRSLEAQKLAEQLVGKRLAARVIEATKEEYDSQSGLPKKVVFYTRPELAYPRINRICQIDVITIEFNWFDHEQVNASTPLEISHIEAASRFKAFEMPNGEPGSPENKRAQMAACANFATAIDAFRAPNAGDAQWLTEIEEEYLKAPRQKPLPFECDDYADRTCKQAAKALAKLALKLATEVKEIDCPRGGKKKWYQRCFRLTFPYASSDQPEWIMSVAAFIRDGSAPVEIGNLKLEHQRKPYAVF